MSKTINKPDSIEGVIWKLFFMLIAYIEVLHLPLISSAPDELGFITFLLEASGVFIQGFVIYKVSQGINWARLITIAGNTIIFILIIGIVVFQGLNGLFSPDSFLNSIGFDTEIMSEHPILTGGFVLLLISTSYELSFTSEILNWFKSIKNKIDLKTRTQRFLKGFSLYIFITSGLMLALEVMTFDYINKYGSDSLSAIQIPISPSMEDALALGISIPLAILTLIWLYYLVVFTLFPLIFNRNGKVSSATSNSNDLNDDDNYIVAYNEVETMNIESESLWIKAYTLAEGDEIKQKAIYVKLRAKEIDEENK